MERKAFSLVEVLIAVLLLSLLAMGMAYVFVGSKQHAKHSYQKLKAMEVGRYFLSSLQMQVRQDQWASNCLGTGSGCPRSPDNDMVIGGVTYQTNSTVTPSYLGTNLSKVKLNIAWNETAP